MVDTDKSPDPSDDYIILVYEHDIMLVHDVDTLQTLISTSMHAVSYVLKSAQSVAASLQSQIDVLSKMFANRPTAKKEFFNVFPSGIAIPPIRPTWT